MYKSTKTFGHELGLSACFRQWRAKSHCRLLHGYPLAFTLTFGADELDERNWVIDFGGLKDVKAFLVETFDHKLVVAADDPQLERLRDLGGSAPVTRNTSLDGFHPSLADVMVIPNVGCEAFAAYVFDHVDAWLIDAGHSPRVHLISVECREHGGNSAIFEKEHNVR